MGNDSLQQLLRQYSQGEISKPEYRHKRTELINDITDDHRAPSTDSVTTGAPPDTQPPRTPGNSDPQLKYVVIVVLLFAAILAFYISGSIGKNKTTSKTGTGLNTKHAYVQLSINHETTRFNIKS